MRKNVVLELPSQTRPVLTRAEAVCKLIDEPPRDVWPRCEHGACLCVGIAKSQDMELPRWQCRLDRLAKLAQLGVFLQRPVR